MSIPALLPEFFYKIQSLLATDERELFIASSDNPPAQGLRFNPIKLNDLTGLAQYFDTTWQDVELKRLESCAAGVHVTAKHSPESRIDPQQIQQSIETQSLERLGIFGKNP